MASADVVISAPDVASVPQDYEVPAAQEIVPLVVTASLDGSAAASTYVPTLEVLSPAGQVVFRSPTTTIVAAGGSADVSWFPLRAAQAPAVPTTAYEGLVLATAGIRAYWKLDETSGITAVDSGNAGYDLEYIGGVTLGEPPLADVFSARLDGSVQQRIGSYVGGTGQPGIQGNGQMSIEGWVKTTDNTGVYIVSSDSSSADGRFFWVFLNPTGVVNYVIFDTGATGYGLVGSAVINDGAKHYFAGTFDGTTQSLYIDGVLDTSAVPGMPPGTLATHNHGVVLGAGFPGIPFYQQWLTGTLDEVALYDLAMTAGDVAAHYAAG